MMQLIKDLRIEQSFSELIPITLLYNHRFNKWHGKIDREIRREVERKEKNRLFELERKQYIEALTRHQSLIDERSFRNQYQVVYQRYSQ
jgi:hypothetical protein